jgi:hypothetical protein
VVNKGSANQYPPQRRNIKNVAALGSASFAPTANHSRQRSPVLGASGKDAKFFNATSNLGLNISDKKHEILGGTGTFNISMNLIPMNGANYMNEEVEGSQGQSNSHIIVKEEHNEEEDDEEETKCSAIPEVNLRVNPNDTTLASSNLNVS